MPGRKRKAATSSSTPISKSKSSSKAMWNSKKKRNNNLSGINEAAAAQLFAEICDDDDPLESSMEGIFTMGEKLGMDATEDIRILVLLWKMGCREKPAQILKQEWMQGCSQLQVDSWEKMQALVPTLDTGFMEQTDFKDFYKFCFQFNRQGTHRTLDKDLVVALLKLVLKERVATDRLETFCEFLETSAEQHSRITLDQWTSFLDFCLECEDLSTYDESTSAWPVLLDEYVDWIEERQKKK